METGRQTRDKKCSDSRSPTTSNRDSMQWILAVDLDFHGKIDQFPWIFHQRLRVSLDQWMAVKPQQKTHIVQCWKLAECSWLCRNNEKSIGYWTPAPFRSKIFPAHAVSGWMASVLVAVDAIIWKPWSRTLNLTNLNRPLINELHGFEFGQTKKRNETANSHFQWLAFNTTLVDWRLKSTCRFTQHDLQIEP